MSYILFSYVNKEIDHIAVVDSPSVASHMLENYAIGYVCDRIGRINYKDTLRGDLKIDEQPVGLYLAFSPTDQDNRFITKIDLYERKQVTNHGYIYNTKEIITEHIGYFAVNVIFDSPKDNKVDVTHLKRDLNEFDGKFKSVIEELKGTFINAAEDKK